MRKLSSKLNMLLPILTLLPSLASAHAVVTASSLEQNPIALNLATEVLLQFNSNIELGLSKVFLVSKGDKLSPVKIARGKKPGALVVHLPALNEPGEYALKYKVFAADGHLTEDVIRFHVQPSP